MRTFLHALVTALGLLVTACQPAAAPAPTAPPSTAEPPATAAKPAPTSAPTAVTAPTPTSAPSVKPAATTAPAPTAAPAAAATVAKPPAPTGPPVALHVSYSNLIADNLPEWQALDSGIFKQNGLDVSLENIASSTGIPALLGDQVQVAHLGGSESVSAAVEGGDIAIIGVTEAVYPFVFMAPSSIGTVEELKGKKIGVSNVGSSSDIATRVMLRKFGIDPEKDVTIVPVGSLQNRTAALLNGAIDAGMAQPPDQLALEDKGFHVIYNMAEQKLPSVGNCIAVRRSWLNSNKEAAQRYIDSLVQAIAVDKKDRRETFQVLSKYLHNEDERALNATYDFFVGTVTPDYPVVKVEQFADALQTLSASNEKVKSFDVSTIVDNEFVQSAMDRHVGP
jgi:NitT/TauT family transport system substrate-binding protein